MTARFSLMALVGVCFAIPGLVFGCDRDAASEGGLDMSENALSGAYFQEGSDGLTSIKTEHNDGVTSANGHSWTLSAEAEASNGAAMTAGPNSGVNQNTDYVTMSPRLDFRVNFVKTGIHYIWVRGRAPDPDTGSNDSCHVGLDGVGVPSADRISSFGAAFGWSKSTMDGVVATVNVSSTGVHVVNLWMREDGFVADKIVLTTSDSFVPTGFAPSESPRGSSSPPVAPILWITQTLFTTQTPAIGNISDGAGINYELGMRFSATSAGKIRAIRFWKAPSETGTHVGRLWSTTGQELASTTFSNETASGWQQATLATPLAVTPNVELVVTVNTAGGYYVATNDGLATAVVNGALRSSVGNNGVYGPPGRFPSNTWRASNYFRDIVFAPASGGGGPIADSGAPAPGIDGGANAAGRWTRSSWARSRAGRT